MKDKTFGNKVVIQMYHNNPPVRTISEMGDQLGQVWCRTVWDRNAEEAAEYSAGWDGKYYDTDPKVKEGVDRAYKAMVLDWLEHDFPDHELPFGKEDTGASVFHLLGRDKQLQSLATRWANELIREDKDGNISGDDTYFDYFPDYCEGLHQLCEQINFPKAWNRAKQWLERKGGSYDLSREFPQDPELPGYLEKK